MTADCCRLFVRFSGQQTFVGLDVLIDSSGQEEHVGSPPGDAQMSTGYRIGGAARHGSVTSGTYGRSRAAGRTEGTRQKMVLTENKFKRQFDRGEETGTGQTR